MKKISKNYASASVVEVNETLKEFEILKRELENHFDFEIVDYIISDILEGENYNHVCLMINLAVLNNRISVENGNILKNKLKETFEINSIYDRLNKYKIIKKKI